MQFSWFYCDLTTRDGLTAVIVFYIRPFFLTFDIALLDVYLYRDDSKEHFAFSRPHWRCLSRPDTLEVEIASGRLWKEDGGYRIQIREKDLYVDILLEPQYPDWQPQEHQLIREGNRYFNWLVYLPRASASGLIRKKGEEIPVSGEAYLDRNQGNLLLNRHLQSWYWGRFHSPRNSIIWGSLAFKNGKLFQPAIVVEPGYVSFQELAEPVVRDTAHFYLPQLRIQAPFTVTGQRPIDAVDFLISRLPQGWILPRRMHEFLFYRADENRFLKRIGKWFSNVQYQRKIVGTKAPDQTAYSGMLEYIRFK